MGKASKQFANKMIRYQEKMKMDIEDNKDDPDFIEMVKAMDPKKSYNIKKNDTVLFLGNKLLGSKWKSIFQITE
ncbi:hypothetical protein LXD69_10080 [Flavobacterium sediminilitoris]|uniref:Uncharacterized protein n=1 Tax=Flavobacterium sediminilitoris TaxID=2024526 RepID=A0ABY4HHU5_9FLAO|nr:MULTISPECIES: hypothetical protein [Flavobacterium]UOX32400.1 hypothetical protein LXD69_10080 [Flavobacterium sediminilitoris]